MAESMKQLLNADLVLKGGSAGGGEHDQVCRHCGNGIGRERSKHVTKGFRSGGIPRGLAECDEGNGGKGNARQEDRAGCPCSILRHRLRNLPATKWRHPATSQGEPWGSGQHRRRSIGKPRVPQTSGHHCVVIRRAGRPPRNQKGIETISTRVLSLVMSRP